ncbi:MAG: hypothetical protein Q9159_007126 [Coniocarpon cinnabarinum]
MAAAVETAQQLAQGSNPNHDPALTADGVAQQLPQPDRGPSSSPPPGVDDDNANDDLEMDVDTRKHMEAPRNHEGKMICVRPGCESMRFDRKCEWSKHMDKHDRPYKCPDPACVKLKGFTYSGGLLRHQREVHKQHGGPKDQMHCPIPFCKRNTGTGFTRKENLNEHIRRVHRQPIPKEPEDATPKRRERRSLRGRRNGVNAGVNGVNEEQQGDVPVDTALMAVSAEGPHAGQPAPEANMAGDGPQDQPDDSRSPYPQADQMALQQSQAAVDQGMTPEQAQHLVQQHQQQAHHPAVPPDFQVGTAGMIEAREYEVAYLRQEVDRLRTECEEKDQKIARLEAGMASMQQGVQQDVQQAETR